jgi:hypothetical protein
MVGQHADSKGIDLSQAGAPSILGDAAHQVDNVMMVGGRRMLVCTGNTECRFSNMLAYRQSPLEGDAAFYLGGTDSMVERITVAQPQYAGAGGQFDSGGAGFRAGTSNSRFVNIKVFGGNATTSPMQSAFYLVGQRNTVTGLEVQDYPGGGIEDSVGFNSYTNVVIDSCKGAAVYGNEEVTITNLLVVNRGGAHTIPHAFNIADGSGAIIDARLSGVTPTFSGAQTGAGNFITVNGVAVP